MQLRIDIEVLFQRKISALPLLPASEECWLAGLVNIILSPSSVWAFFDDVYRHRFDLSAAIAIQRHSTRSVGVTRGALRKARAGSRRAIEDSWWSVAGSGWSAESNRQCRRSVLGPREGRNLEQVNYWTHLLFSLKHISYDLYVRFLCSICLSLKYVFMFHFLLQSCYF